MTNNPELDWAIPLLCEILLTDRTPNNRILAARALLKAQPLPQQAIDTLTRAALNDPDSDVRGSIIRAIRNQIISPVAKAMSDEPKVQMNFNAPVYGAAGTVEGDQIVHAQDAEFLELLEDYKQFIAKLDSTSSAASTVSEIIDVEFRPLAQTQPQRWQKFLTLKRLWNGGKKATIKLGEHFTEESLVGKAAIAFLDGLLDEP